MTEEKTRFEALIDKELDNAKSGQGAYAKLYDQQKTQWLATETQKMIATTGSVTADDQQKLVQQFDSKWDQNKDGTIENSLKASAMKAYNGDSKETQVENAANTAMDKAGSVIGGGVSSMLMGGDFTGGLSHGLRHAIMGLIMSIPFVGEFLGQAMGWMGSKVKSLFGSEEKSLSWSEAGDKVTRDKIKERMGAQLGQYADVNQLAKLVDEAGKNPGAEQPADGRVLLDKDKDGKINATELDVNKDTMLTTADREGITKQLNNQEATQKLFEELKQQGVTFDNQKVSELTTQSIPAATPSGSSQSR